MGRGLLNQCVGLLVNSICTHGIDLKNSYEGQHFIVAIVNGIFFAYFFLHNDLPVTVNSS